jgi:mannose-6-phosphate isomerase
MNPNASQNIAKSKKWLAESVFPLWTKNGLDARTGGFAEALSWDAQPLEMPRRAMVQSRQIYSFRIGLQLGCCPADSARAVIARAAAQLVERYSLPSGAFIHAVDAAGKPQNERPDLYTQAFALFGLANAYAVAPDPALKRRALALAGYLRRERRAPGGGYTEIENDAFVLRSNPHMHLFEAALAWMAADPDPLWKELAEEVLNLCLAKFIDPRSGALCEQFSDGWAPVRAEGHFFFEPGHHYEWSWLMMLHEELTGRKLGPVRDRLFQLAETCGISPLGNAFDEVWDHGVVKKRSSRFWPQGERTKAAVRLGARSAKERQAGFARAADGAFAALFRFLEVPKPGLWRDTLLEDGRFREEPAKASSLYHIINACDEYIAFRPGLQDPAV